MLSGNFFRGCTLKIATSKKIDLPHRRGHDSNGDVSTETAYGGTSIECLDQDLNYIVSKRLLVLIGIEFRIVRGGGWCR